MPQPLIQTIGLGKDHRIGDTTVQAVQNVSLQVEAEEFIAIMGPSGSGKSTLVHILGLLDTPTAGRYIFAGTDVSALGRDARAAIRNRKMGFVFQNFNLLARNTALENVELPLIYAGIGRAERRCRAMTALEAVGLGHRVRHWPHQLSGGEQQRVSIARALVNDPLLIFADEPTGALDSRMGSDVMQQLQRLNRSGRTIVMVTHDPVLARNAHRIIELGDGCVTNDTAVPTPLDATSHLKTLTDGRPTEDIWA